MDIQKILMVTCLHYTNTSKYTLTKVFRLHGKFTLYVAAQFYFKIFPPKRFIYPGITSTMDYSDHAIFFLVS